MYLIFFLAFGMYNPYFWLVRHLCHEPQAREIGRPLSVFLTLNILSDLILSYLI